MAEPDYHKIRINLAQALQRDALLVERSMCGSSNHGRIISAPSNGRDAEETLMLGCHGRKTCTKRSVRRNATPNHQTSPRMCKECPLYTLHQCRDDRRFCGGSDRCGSFGRNRALTKCCL